MDESKGNSADIASFEKIENKIDRRKMIGMSLKDVKIIGRSFDDLHSDFFLKVIGCCRGADIIIITIMHFI
jgi:hypothetical protein